LLLLLGDLRAGFEKVPLAMADRHLPDHPPQVCPAACGWAQAALWPVPPSLLARRAGFRRHHPVLPVRTAARPSAAPAWFSRWSPLSIDVVRNLARRRCPGAPARALCPLSTSTARS
jgi:hypothetical protein